jgi:PHD/YefM family antitoxin component YafN of YafNO toxin-antitoxin module
MYNKKKPALKSPFKVPPAPKNPRIGKAQARKDFLPLVSSLKSSHQTIEITEHGRSVAVLLDYITYQDLISKSTNGLQSFDRVQSLKGSVKILGDLEQARKEINEEFRKSIERRS